MKNKRIQLTVALCLLPVLLGVREIVSYASSAGTQSVDTIYLLVPDNVGPSDPVAREWADAAEEEGLHLALLHDSEFLSPLQRSKPIPGLIVPDSIHRTANATLIGALHEYVHQGGNLMVVYDACTWDLDSHFARIQSRLSDLVGVGYALYERYTTDSIHWSSVWGDSEAMKQLGIPPGKYVLAGSNSRGKVRPVSLPDRDLSEDAKPERDQLVLSRYEFGDLHYPAFRTASDFDGKVLLHSSGGVAAGIRKDNLGQVMFVNLPLSYLEERTDGMLMHSFLRYFGVKMVGVPYLSSVPDGTGGLVFNWHIDAKSMAAPLQQLIAAGVFDRGPYSIDFTAGPDVDQPGDGKGLNVGHDAETDRLIKELQHRRHTIGSHGGWIHNYFGEHVSDNNEKEFSKYIEWNIEAIQKVTGKPVVEYSAPLGNQPPWVSRWLEKRHINCYYFAGDTGMGPTQVYRGSTRDGENIWAFPIVHLGPYASLEEMGFANVRPQVVEEWLSDVADFVAEDRSARLIYTHPLGATKYIGALRQFLSHADQLAGEHRFRWYTMAELADFMNTRKKVEWSLLSKGSDSIVLKASSPETLNGQTWIFSKAQYDKPTVRHGKVQVSSDNENWLLSAGDCKEMSVEMVRNQQL
ncbi:MAG: polysaccharide deacetylase family protein [Terriglobales bacterium]